MATDLNKVILIGRTKRDLELETFAECSSLEYII